MKDTGRLRKDRRDLGGENSGTAERGRVERKFIKEKKKDKNITKEDLVQSLWEENSKIIKRAFKNSFHSQYCSIGELALIPLAPVCLVSPVTTVM